MQLRDRALSKRDDLGPGELEMLVEGRHIGPIARHTVERLCQHCVELTRLRVLKQRLHAGSEGRA